MKTHIIRWVSSVAGMTGAGKRLFEKEEAEQLAVELNSTYPDIDHEAVPAVPSAEMESVVSLADGAAAAAGGLPPGPPTESGIPPPTKSIAE